jgi:hypothetical protein
VPSLLESEWRQGTVLPHNLLPDGVLPLSVTSDAKLVIISHDCDLVNPSYDLEPYLEFLVARPRTKDDRDGRMFNGKNPRRLQFFAEEKGEPCLYEIEVHEKYRADRRILETGQRDTSVKIREGDVHLIANWGARRYNRPSLPTAFMDRVSAQTKRISKKLEKDGEDITCLYLAFNSFEELPAEKPYRIILRVIVPDYLLEDDSREKRANSVVSELQRLLAQCDGVELEDAKLVGESEITLNDLRSLIRWDTDYLSPEEAQTAK